MDHRIFGRQITNLTEQESLRAKRNYSFLHNQRPKEAKVILTSRNKSFVAPNVQHTESKMVTSDPQMVPAYFEQNLKHLRSLEGKNSVIGNYILEHKTSSQSSRAKLIDWLCQLHYKYKMFPETIFTVVTFIDKYLAKKTVPLAELQLVGIAALLIAAKFEETYQVPRLSQLISASANQYTAKQLLNMEADMLSTFNFELIVNSTYKFYEPLAKIAELQTKNFHLGQYILELALTKPSFLQYPASLVASSTIFLIKKIRKSQNPWNEDLQRLSNYKQSDLRSCAKDLCNLLEQTSTQDNCKALKKKFSLPAFSQVAKIKLQRKK